MNLRQRWLPLVLGFIVVSFLLLTLATRPRSEGKLNETPVAVARPADSPQVDKINRGPSTERAPEPQLSAVEKFIHQESQRVGRPDPHPDETYSRLKRVAQNLKRDDVEALKRSAINADLNNDRRFLSVYMLALNQSQEVMPALMSIALEPLSIQDVSSRLYAEELMIRTQALEGLAKIPGAKGPGGAIENFLRHQDNAFLADQAKRLLRGNP